ncbi:MAG: FAD-dependent oxidoreductase [Gammaproteobacteria bacterium]|jgi:isorenieratene synthase|nr:FAD-dependent oxidoreductase [Gammaproteobacteria bacterium]
MQKPLSPHAQPVFMPWLDGRAARLEATRHVAVIGGGLAGLAAATVLAERGARVTLLERDGHLGGRAGAWSDQLRDGTRFEMERGFHAFFRQYYNLRQLLRRVDPQLGFLSATTDYPILTPTGNESFAGLRHSPLRNVATLTWRTETLGLRDLVKVNVPAAMEMLRFERGSTYARFDPQTAGAYLDSLRFPPLARQRLLHVFAHSCFNPQADMSAAELLQMMHFYFTANHDGLVFDVANRPFSSCIFTPLGKLLERQGVVLRTGVSARALVRRDGDWVVDTDRDSVTADAVVLATDVPGVKSLVAASPTLDDTAWRAAVDTLRVTNAFAVWRLWLDRPVAAGRAQFAGTAGVGPLDNISVFELLEDESRDWAARTGGSVVELHAYALPSGAADTDALRRELLAGLHTLYPETAGARIIEERFLLRQDCPAFAPGSHAVRPETATPWRGLALAGDFVKLPFPTALMERAAAAGFLAASTLLDAWDVSPEPLWSVALRGPAAWKRPA